MAGCLLPFAWCEEQQTHYFMGIEMKVSPKKIYRATKSWRLRWTAIPASNWALPRRKISSCYLYPEIVFLQILRFFYTNFMFSFIIWHFSLLLFYSANPCDRSGRWPGCVALSTCWKATATPVQMLMYGREATAKNRR